MLDNEIDNMIMTKYDKDSVKKNILEKNGNLNVKRKKLSQTKCGREWKLK